MTNPGKTGISNWVRRILLAHALIPLSIVGAALVVVYLLTNERVHEKHSETLETRARAYLMNISRLQAAMVGERLAQVASDVDTLAWHIGQALDRPARLRLDRHKQIAYSPEGQLYTLPESRGFAIHSNGAQPPDHAGIDRLQRLLSVDPLMQDIHHRHPEAIRIRFSSRDSLHITYPPPADPPARPGLVPSPFPDTQDDNAPPSAQERRPLWTGIRMNPKEGAWTASRIAPVLRGELLEGVITMDIRIDRILGNWRRLDLPWQGHSLLLDHNRRAIRIDNPAPASSGSSRLDTGEDWIRTVLEQGRGTRRIPVDGGQLVAWSTIPDTQWRMLTLAPVGEILNDAEQVRNEVANIGWLMLAGLVAIYLTLLTLLRLNAHGAARRLLRPLAGLTRIAQEIGNGRFEQSAPDTPLAEIREAGQSLIRSGQRLKQEIESRESDGLSLQQAYQEVTQRLDRCAGEKAFGQRERKRLESSLRYASVYDPLTGLPNRLLFFDRARHALAQAARSGSPLAFLLVVAEGTNNDTELGDEHLRTLATRLRSNLRAGDTVARLDSREFVMLLTDLRSTRQPEALARALVQRLRTPPERGEQENAIHGRLGLAVYPDDGDKVEVLLHQADAATYPSGQSGESGSWHLPVP